MNTQKKKECNHKNIRWYSSGGSDPYPLPCCEKCEAIVVKTNPLKERCMSKIIPKYKAYQEFDETDPSKPDPRRIFRGPDGKLRVHGRVRPNVIFEGAPLGKAIEL